MTTTCALIASALGAAGLAQGPVPLPNPGFEEACPDRAGMPLGWGHYPGSPTDDRMQFVWDDGEARSGERSACLVVGGSNTSWLPLETSAYAVTLDKADLTPGRPTAVVGHEYVLAAWVKGEGAGRKGAGLVLRWTDDDGWIPSYVREYFQLPGDDWQLVAVSATAPEGAKYVVPILQVSGSPEAGRLWFDDISLVDRTGLKCDVRRPPELSELPSTWRCELAVTSEAEAALPLVVSVRPSTLDTEPGPIEGSVSADSALIASVEYVSERAHQVQYAVQSPDDPPAVYFASTIEMQSPLDARVLSPRYRSTLFGSSEGKLLRLQTQLAVSDDLRESCRLSVGVLVEGQRVVEKSLDKPPRAGLVELTLPELPAGSHEVLVAVSSEGQTIAEQRLPLHSLPGITPAAAGGDRNELLVDGEPVFPIGFYSTLTEDFPRFRQEGFNTVLTYTSSTEACANMAQAAGDAGLKLIVSALRPALPDRNAEQVEQATERLKNLPGLLGYYLWDEPTVARPGQTPEDMRWLYEQAMASDPEHLTCTVFCRPSEIEHYRDTTDVFLVDPYPTHHGREPDLTMVADWVDAAREAVEDTKPVWLVPQAFDHLLGPGTYRMPTIEEQRCMCYLGLVHGAKGIIWFVYTGFCIHSDEVAAQRGLPPGQVAWVFRGTIPQCFPLRWEGIKQIVHEVNELSPVLLSADPDQAQEVPSSREAIHTLLKRHNGSWYLFAVNPRNEAAELERVVPVANASADVLWEERSVPITGGRLADKFKPYEVHVYRFQAG